MRRSALSKGSGYSSVFNGNDQSLDILRISLKKQMDRKEKLQRLMQKYEQITNQQKSHIKSIKASIIQLKDIECKSKTKFFINPIIYVDNNLCKQTREFLCMLLNTFYAKYQQNSELQFKTKQVNVEMNLLLEAISLNQEMLLKIQKETIGQQVQLEGELYSLKGRLKEEIGKSKEIQDEYVRISKVNEEYQAKFDQQLDRVSKLREKCKNIQLKIQQNKQQVAQGQLIKKGKQQLMASEIAYEQKFHNQIQQINQNIQQEHSREKDLIRKIRAKKENIHRLKAKLNPASMIGRDQINYQTDMKIIDAIRKIQVR